jgi:ribosomal protein S18 acetylase RimI-like enzyme
MSRGAAALLPPESTRSLAPQTLETYSVFQLPSLSSAADVQLLWKVRLPALPARCWRCPHPPRPHPHPRPCHPLRTQAAMLHREAFHEPPQRLALLEPLTGLAYAGQSLGLQLMTYFMQGSNHLTLLAFEKAGAGAGSSSGGGGGGLSEALLDERVVGTANASLRIADEGFCKCIDCAPGTPFVIVTNMSVSERHRGRGLGRQLLHAALEAAQAQFRPAAQLLVLMVYQDNDAAVALYRSSGFRETSWVDPRWLRDAERGRVGRPRRLLMVKRAAGAAAPA